MSRIRIKRGDEVVLNVPVNAGIVGLCIAPLASVVGIVAAFGFKCVIEVVKTDGTIIDVSDAVTDKARSAAEYSSDKFEDIKSKSKEYIDKAKESEIYEKTVDKAQNIKEKAEELKDKISKGEEADGEAPEEDEINEEAAEEAVEEAVEEAAEEAAAEAAEAEEEKTEE